MALSVIVRRPERFAARVVAPLPSRPAVDVVVPVFNAEAELAGSVRRLHRFLHRELPFSARITIADNASTDATGDIADALAAELPDLRVLHLNEKGRGRALAAAWMTSEARVVACMDIDLSTRLDALLPLVAPVLSGHSEVSVTREAKRDLISRACRVLLRVGLGERFRDVQCGFKAVRADVARRLVPEVVDRGWFFDTELLLRAERAGVHIHEVPVDRVVTRQKSVCERQQ